MNQDDPNNSNLIANEVLLRFLATSPASSRGSGSAQAEDSPNRSQLCPEAGRYAELTIGSASQVEADALLAHVAGCDRCGRLLAGSLAALAGNPSVEEAAAIAELAAMKEWQREMARQAAATRARKKPWLRSFGSTGNWLVAGSVAAGLIVFAAVFAWQLQQNTPDRELALAYSQSRRLELRVPEAGYASMTTASHTRGSLEDREPAPLLDARAKLSRALERSPQDEHWLALQARADLLEERYDSAIDILDRLIAEGSVSAELLTDGASAYFQRGLLSGSEIDRSTSLDYLRRADGLAPTDPVVLFNEAIVMEDRGQMMNAVEVWNRYITVERDEKWKAEGKRKLTSLEQKLNRLKTHQSRLMQMIETPQAMDALSRDPQRLASWDEELTSIELDKVVPTAFPILELAKGQQPVRGSPRVSSCLNACQAARRLLRALGTSLETNHQDFWLSDLLPPELDSLSPTTYDSFAQAMLFLAQATREDQTGVPTTGARLAKEARLLFEQLAKDNQAKPAIARAAHTGEERSAIEYMFALQRATNFRDCHAFGSLTFGSSQALRELARYPWMEAVAFMTEGVCDDTGAAYSKIDILLDHALNLAQSSHYQYLVSRTRLRKSDELQTVGDIEDRERIILALYRELIAVDAPLIRVFNTISSMQEDEHDSARVYLLELWQRENIALLKLAGNQFLALSEKLDLVRTELRLGEVKESERLLREVQEEERAFDPSGTAASLVTEVYIFLANATLERGDSAGAERYLALARQGMGHYSDNWGLHAYAGAVGLLALDHGQVAEAGDMLEKQIHSSEGTIPPASETTNSAEYARSDHDLYAELAATWLAQGRRPEQVLALWERFRLRSHGLPVARCVNSALDCDQPHLLEAQRRLGQNVVIGQIALLDRILVYRMDQTSIRWSQKPYRRQDLVDASGSLQRTVSLPYSTMQSTKHLSQVLSDAFLPASMSGSDSNATLLLEPDSQFENLPWPLLPTSNGPLGLTYPIAELRSILARGRSISTAAGAKQAELIVGASMAAEREPPLPEALDEALRVSRFAHAPELLMGKQATTDQVGEALQSATLFHFAGHAIQNEKGTELLLAAGSKGERRPWIDGDFLRRHAPRACRLAVLSACATGKRDASWNSPLQDIVETLGSLGVPDVVATRWQIDSKAAVPFMDTFYGSMSKGESVAMALTEARRVQSRQSQNSSPYYWASYYVTETENSH